MDTVRRLADLSDQIANLELTAEWIANESEYSDDAVAKAAALITIIADEIREELVTLVKDLERGEEATKLN